MDIKGTAFLARRRFVIEKCGQDAWDNFVQRIKKDTPSLSGIVLAGTLIPSKDFLKFQERLTAELFRNDKSTYWTMGSETAKWSLGQGPYRSLLGSNNVVGFAANVPQIWRTFYTEGSAALDVVLPNLRFTVKDLPEWHIYYELVASGFVHGALEMVTGKTIAYAREGGGARTMGYTYLFGPLP